MCLLQDHLCVYACVFFLTLASLYTALSVCEAGVTGSAESHNALRVNVAHVTCTRISTGITYPMVMLGNTLVVSRQQLPPGRYPSQQSQPKGD